jgi:hypothetical protein
MQYPMTRGKLPDSYLPDFADHRPDAYRAFELAAVRSTNNGVQVGLPGRMCLDKHVPDLLACLPCWFRRNIGDPALRPWRLHCFDLSHNGLSDESIVQIVGSLRMGGVRVQRLLLAGNRIQSAAAKAITEYAWDSTEALCELDLSENEISVGRQPSGDDPVSALLRCFYNHSAYPRRMARSHWVSGQREAFDLEPLVLRVGGNLLQDPIQLLGLVCEKGGRERVRLRPGPDAYQPCRDEFLSLCLPDFSRQRKSVEAVWERSPPATDEKLASKEEQRRPDLDEFEERDVQQALTDKIAELCSDLAFAGDPSGAARWTVAGLVLALLRSGRASGSMTRELEAVLGARHAKPMLDWTTEFLRTLRC